MVINRDEIIFNGVSSLSLGIHVETFPNYVAPQKTYETFTVPGRHGTLCLPTGTFENVERTYEISFGKHVRGKPITYFTEMATKVAQWLMSGEGYVRLEDGYEPDYYRMAVYSGGLDIENILNQGGRATITFDCMPQRFLKEGEQPVRVANPVKYGTASGQPIVDFRSDDVIRLQHGTIYVIDRKAYLWNWNNTLKSAYINSPNFKWPSHTADFAPKIDKILCGEKQSFLGLELLVAQGTFINPTQFDAYPLIVLAHSTWTTADPNISTTYPIFYICFDNLDSEERIVLKMEIRDLLGGIGLNDICIDTEQQLVYTFYNDSTKPIPHQQMRKNWAKLLTKIYDPVTGNEVTDFPKLKKGTTVIRIFADQPDYDKQTNLFCDNAFDYITVYPRWWTV